MEHYAQTCKSGFGRETVTAIGASLSSDVPSFGSANLASRG
ncbi:hypothetical protein SAMN05519105_0972 [Rhodobacter sp. 24-YEA-8]|nr:hypothetical protein SAMN05519105_0972 [Rhodobacter sp. 24-YEA-8]